MELDSDGMNSDTGAEVADPPVRGRGKKAPTASKADATRIEIPALKIGILTLTLQGETPLVVHKFSQKAGAEILAKHMGAARQKRVAKVPVNDFLASLHYIGKPPIAYERNGETYAQGKFGFPAGGIKSAAVGACRLVAGINMVYARGAFHVRGTGPENLVPIISSPPRMRMDVVRLKTGPKPVPDIRFRGEFAEWSTRVTLEYDTKAITASQLANLFNQAGFSVGLGEWRTDKGGEWGRFKVASTLETQVRRGGK